MAAAGRRRLSTRATTPMTTRTSTANSIELIGIVELCT
jgi:hypothetical protein